MRPARGLPCSELQVDRDTVAQAQAQAAEPLRLFMLPNPLCTNSESLAAKMINHSMQQVTVDHDGYYDTMIMTRIAPGLPAREDRGTQVGNPGFQP